ncbi:hypothetical protein [Streptomyces sp. H27-S2]|uniref:ATP-dependent DNA ligase n=1 Tax=Streptomyces antarcticus TaxID=2996458 RepID=UPI00226FB45E|nr:hypothetical protein [Streptomyces sp. H27-S2]MCY0951454.1 hypothetical protein [Streptomyces sp. H27-S2]
MSFEALQRRAAARGRTATALAGKTPAFFIAFDALRADGTELLTLPHAERRRRLEVLFATRQKRHMFGRAGFPLLRKRVVVA